MTTPTRSVASDYAVAGILLFLYNNDANNTLHSYPIETLCDRLTSSVNPEFSLERTGKFVHMIESLGIGTFFDDPFAVPVFQISDDAISKFFTGRANARDIYARAWNLELEWLKTAFVKPEFWEQVDRESLELASTLIPSHTGSLTLDSNSEAFKQASELLDELLQKLSKSNDVGAMSPTEVAAAQEEVTIIRGELSKAEVEGPDFFHMSRQTLTWIAKQAVGSVVGALALAALAAIFNIPIIPF
jgi:hypothetical protein